MHENASFEWVINFGENQPFRGAEMVYPTIALLRHKQQKETFHSMFVDGVIPYSELGTVIEKSQWAETLSQITAMQEWRFQPKELTQLFQKISQQYQSLEQVTGDVFYYGLLTGLNEAFIVSDEVKNQLISEDRSSAEIIRPMIGGSDLRPWYHIVSGDNLLVMKQGVDIDKYPAVKKHLLLFERDLSNRSMVKSGDTLWFELRPCDYYEAFSKPKIMWAEIVKLPRFSFEAQGKYTNNKVSFICTDNLYLLAILQSRITWFFISQIATPLRLRAGLWQYQLYTQFVKRIPIPPLTIEQEAGLAAIAEEITGLAAVRYGMHEDVRRTIRGEFDGGAIDTRVALYRWWNFADEKALSDEIKRQFGQEIPLKQRAEWRGFLDEQKAEHQRLTADIVTLETRMNAIVYDAFNLTAEERDLIERTTKYPYGEV